MNTKRTFDTGYIWAFIFVFDIAGIIFLATIFFPQLITFWKTIKEPLEKVFFCSFGLLLLILGVAYFRIHIRGTTFNGYYDSNGVHHGDA